MADFKRLEQVRLHDNRGAANDLESWEDERNLLNARINELALGHGPGSPNLRLPHGNALHPAIASVTSASRRGVHESLEGWRNVYVDGYKIDELRSKLAEVKRETDRQVQHAAEADEIAHHWFVQTQHVSPASCESLSAEVALLHAHIASNEGDGANRKHTETLLDNVADYVDCAVVKRQMVRIFEAWACLSANGRVIRDSFDHLYQCLGMSTVNRVMNDLATHMHQNASLDTFKVITGLMLRISRRPPFRTPYLAWAYVARRNRLLWRRASGLIFASINARLRNIVHSWRRVLAIKNRNQQLVQRRTLILIFRCLQVSFLCWTGDVRDASKIFILNRRNRMAYRRTVLQRVFPPWEQYMYKHKWLKQGWKSLKAARLFRTHLRPFKGWHVLTMHKMHALLYDYLPSTAAAPDPTMLDPALSGRQLWSLDFTVHLAQLILYRCYRMRLRRNECFCAKMVLDCQLLKCMCGWKHVCRKKMSISRFSVTRQIRAIAHICLSSFGTWALQHPRRTNLLQLSTGTKFVEAKVAEQAEINHDEQQDTGERGDDAHDMLSMQFLQSLMPMKPLQVARTPDSEQGTTHMYFVWKTVVSQFEMRLTRTHNAKLNKRAFGFWLDYTMRQNSMYRKQTLLQLRWFQTPLLIIWTRWSAWSHDNHFCKSILAKHKVRKQFHLLLQTLYHWNLFRLLQIKCTKIKQVVENKLRRHHAGLLHHCMHRWCSEGHRDRMLLVAEKRLVRRTVRYALQKAFLHFSMGINVRADLIMQPWTRCIVNQAATEHFVFGVINETSCAAHVSFLLYQTFHFWVQMTKQRLAIITRCHYGFYTLPLQRAFRAWSSFARVKHRMVEGLHETHHRHVSSVLDTCYDMIQAWGWFTRLRRHAQKQLHNHLQRLVRYTLRPLIQDWQQYASARAILTRRAARFLAAKETRRGQVWLAFAVRFWRAYSASQLALAHSTAICLVSGEAKHANTLSCNALAFWRGYTGATMHLAKKARRVFAIHQLSHKSTILQLWKGLVRRNISILNLALRLRLRQTKYDLDDWRHYLCLNHLKMSAWKKHCCAITKQRYLIWAAYSADKVRLARKSIKVMQRSELCALSCAFAGLRHGMVAAEIAAQYRTCLRDIHVGSCAGHAFRVWLKYLRQYTTQQEYTALRDHRRVFTLVIFVFRAWWVRSRRIQKVKMILHLVRFINSHLLRRCLWKWKRSIRENRIQAAQAGKTIVREAFFLCYTVFRMWEKYVNILLIDLNLRLVTLEEDLLRCTHHLPFLLCAYHSVSAELGIFAYAHDGIWSLLYTAGIR